METDVPATETSPSLPAAGTSEATRTPVLTPSATSVPPTVAATPTAAPTATPAGPEYGFQVSYTLDAEPDDPATGPPEGERWIVVVTAVQNQSAQAIVIERQSLALVDEEGERYLPDEPDEETQPPLVGARLEAGEDLLGLARFAVPEDSEPLVLEWCPGTSIPCSQPLTAPIP